MNDSDLFKVSTHSSASLVVIFSLVSSEILTRDLELWMFNYIIIIVIIIFEVMNFSVS